MSKRPNVLILLGLVLGFCPEARAGIVAHYFFNEAGGGTAADAGGGVTGTLLGAAAFAPGTGIQGGALYIAPGSGGMVSMGDNFGFGTGSFFVHVRFLLSAVAVASYFLGIGDVGDGCSAPARIHFYPGYPCTGVSTNVVNDGNWRQAVAVHDSTTLVPSLDVNGHFQSASPGGNDIVATTAPFLVGGLRAGRMPVNLFTGSVDELRIYDHALTAAEGKARYSTAGAEVPEPGAIR